jgi:flagellar assembly protein FliH
MASPIVPRDQLSAYQRWELGSFDHPPRTNTGRREEDTVDRREEARKEGYSEGHREGHREGLQAGHREALAEMAPRIAVMEQLIASLKTDLSCLDQELATDVLQLALAVARNLVGSALQARPEIVQECVEQALKQLAQNYGPVRLVVNPLDAELVRGVLETAQLAGGWSLKADERISRGGCKVETAAGELDATLETRWQRAIAVLGQPIEWIE